jgi:Icc-related predicted phosphoesterase
MNLKILLLSDLQGIEYREWMNFLSIDQSLFDVLFFLGDIDQMQLQVIVERFASKGLMGVLGNHDYPGDLEYYGITNIHGVQITLMNYTVVGLEGSIKYKNEAAPMFTQEEAYGICNNLPQADILISHNSPKGLHDKSDLAHEGFYGLKTYIEEKCPKFAFHGHQHANRVTKFHNTWVISVYGGIIFDTETKSIEHVLTVLE